MDADAVEEDGLAIEQNLFVARLNGAESDLVADSRGVEGDIYAIQLRILRAPQLQGFRLNIEN